MIKSPWAAAAACLVVFGAVFGLPDEAAAQANFDCRQPRSETIAIVCEDPTFSAQDRQIDSAYRTALEEATEPDRARDNHTAWTRSLSVCGSDRDCIGRSMDEQLDALEYAAASGRRERAAAAEFPGSEPAYGPAPPVDRQPTEPSLEEALEVASDLMGQGAEGTEVSDPVADEVRPSENRSFEPDQAEEAVSPSDAGAPPPSSMEQMAGGGLILGFIVAVLAALLATKALADHSMRKFGWPMILNWWNILHLVAGFALWAGAAMGSPFGGLVVAGGIWLIVLAVNVRKTDLLTGVTMSVVQPFVVAILFVVFQLARSKPKP
ncbi:MAG: hypothetical protein CL683_10995 [Brevundimonas sp.]|uniref:hypothetical protein n=1 Tax=Brevundimonas sp. TaxID=1871086 RepID=UPI000C3DC3CA|nr:hypothetical protein [Brevundimonas sp.]MAL89407.1 hypothetical protein [Brevundimonas sp.]